MSETKEFVEYTVESTSRQTNEQKPSTGQGWSNTDSQKLETTELPTSSEDDRYELIKQSLFWVDANLVDDKKYLEELVDEWLTQAPNLKLEKNQKKLNTELLNSIIKDFNLKNYDSFSSLKQFLASNKDLKAILNLKRGELETTLLHVFVGQGENMYALLEAGADPNIQDNKGKTPLHDTALYNCEYEDVYYLLEAGANPNIRDNEGTTPLHRHAACCDEVSKKIVDLLISKGANPAMQDNNGKTPMQIAIDNNNYNIIECFFTEKQKKLNEELNKLIKGTSRLENGFFQCNDQGVNDLEKFLDEHKNDKDLKVILNIKDSEGNSKVLRDDMYTQVINLLLAAGATESQIMATEQETEAPYVPHQCLWDTLPGQLRQLNKFVSKISEAGNITELQKVVNEAIMSGVRLNLAKDINEYFTDYVLGRINQLEKNYEVASGIVCTLISKGAGLGSWDSSDVIDTIALEFKDHKANMIKAHEEYVNRTQKFLKIAKNATNSKLNCAKIDNTTFYLKYSENSTIDVAKITDGARDLGLTHGEIGYGRDVIKIGKSEVEIITENGIRNYTDLANDSDIVLTFYTNQGKLEVRLYPDKQNEDRIRVEVSDQEMLKKLEDCKEKIGRNCRLGELLVKEAIKQGFFTRSGKLCQSSETMSSVAQTMNRRQQLLQDLRNIESNIVKKEKNFDIKTHLIDIFKTLSKLSEEKENVSKTDLANVAEKESKRLGLEGRYNWNELFGLEKKVPQNVEQEENSFPLSNTGKVNDLHNRNDKLVSSVSNQVVKYSTQGDGNCFFHAVFGNNSSDVYKTDRAQEMRQEWHKFLSQFESLGDPKMPEALKERLLLVFQNIFSKESDFCTSNLYKEYLNRISKQIYFIYVEEAPILASLANIEVDIHCAQGPVYKIKPNPDMINADYKRNQELWGGKVRETIYHEENHYSRAEVTRQLQKQTQEQKDSSCYLSLPRCNMDELKVEEASHQHKALLVSGP